MADINENALEVVNLCDYVRCMNGNNSNLISVKDLLSILLKTHTSIGSSSTDWNTLTTDGIYDLGGKGAFGLNNPGFGYGVLCVIVAGSFIFQISISHPSCQIAIRAHYENTWDSWRYLNPA